MSGHEVHSITHTQVHKNRQNKTFHKALELAESQGYRNIVNAKNLCKISDLVRKISDLVRNFAPLVKRNLRQSAKFLTYR